MRTLFLTLLACLPMILPTTATAASSAHGLSSKTVLLHGLARSNSSMQRLAEQLQNQGHKVCNVDYPSRHYDIETLATQHVLPAIHACFGTPLPALNFVTHSLGGIIVRTLRAQGKLEKIARVVMLGPPNHGSEVVDKLHSWAAFSWLNGPAGQQLGTADDAWPQQLGPADFELGIIAGDFSINPILSMMIPGDDDGKVSLASARLEGMTDYRIMSVSHPFLMKNRKVIEQALYFLDNGQFLAAANE